MRITERKLRATIRSVLLSELEGRGADEWEAAHREADRISSSRPTHQMPEKKQDILGRLARGIDILIGPELRELDKFLSDLGL